MLNKNIKKLKNYGLVYFSKFNMCTSKIEMRRCTSRLSMVVLLAIFADDPFFLQFTGDSALSKLNICISNINICTSCAHIYLTLCDTETEYSYFWSSCCVLLGVVVCISSILKMIYYIFATLHENFVLCKAKHLYFWSSLFPRCLILFFKLNVLYFSSSLFYTSPMKDENFLKKI
jgi:hypothetical protein